jgi:F-type H+-transporting ATPase subunit b
MDALNSLGIDWKLLLAQIINFLILFLILRKFLFAPIVKMLGERKDKIAKGLKDAQSAQERLDEASAEAKKVVSKAMHEAQTIIASAKKEAEDQKNKIIAEAQEKATKTIQEAKERAKAEEDKLVAHSKSRLGELVVVALEKILGTTQDEKSIDKVISQLK